MNPAINWEFLCKDLTGNIKVLQYNEIFEITSGIQYRVHFKTLKTIYVYIFLYGTDENIILLFPSNVIYFGNRLNTGIIYSIPEENDRWLPLEQNTHIKNLYIIGTGNRQKKLEKLIKQYLTSFKNQNLNANQKETIKYKLLEEIIRIDRSNSCYVVYAEKPNTFLGDVQDDEKQKEIEWILEENNQK